MSTAPEQFIGLSSALTGFTPAELQATGMCQTYYSVMTAMLGGGPVGDLLSAWQNIEAHAHGDAEALAALLEERMMEDPRLAPMARNLASLWYLGQWNQMPGKWRSRYGAAAADITHVVSAEAYREGLVWPTIGAHPMGARQQGYGAWSLPPDGVRDDE